MRAMGVRHGRVGLLVSHIVRSTLLEESREGYMAWSLSYLFHSCGSAGHIVALAHKWKDGQGGGANINLRIGGTIEKATKRSTNILLCHDCPIITLGKAARGGLLQ
jgi:hypothetical protein